MAESSCCMIARCLSFFFCSSCCFILSRSISFPCANATTDEKIRNRMINCPTTLLIKSLSSEYQATRGRHYNKCLLLPIPVSPYQQYTCQFLNHPGERGSQN